MTAGTVSAQPHPEPLIGTRFTLSRPYVVGFVASKTFANIGLVRLFLGALPDDAVCLAWGEGRADHVVVFWDEADLATRDAMDAVAASDTSWTLIMDSTSESDVLTLAGGMTYGQ